MDQVVVQVVQLVLSGLGILGSVAPQLVGVFTGGQSLEQVTTALRASGVAIPVDTGPTGEYTSDLSEREKRG